MASIAVVLGSVRPGRAGEQVVRWIEEQSLQVEGVNPIFIDLRDYDLPLFAEEMSPSMQAPTLPEAVRRESELLAPVRERADFVINTTGLTLAMLQKRICEYFADGGTRRDILVNVVSFGFKYGIPIDADLVFDVRFLPNPFYVEKLRPMSGMDAEVQEYVLRSDVAKNFLSKLTDMVDFLLPQYAAEGRYALTIGIGCTGGQHRSVAVAKVLTDYLAARDANVRLRNRDFPKT